MLPCMQLDAMSAPMRGMDGMQALPPGDPALPDALRLLQAQQDAQAQRQQQQLQIQQQLQAQQNQQPQQVVLCGGSTSSLSFANQLQPAATFVQQQLPAGPRERRASYEERSAMRLRVYLEQQQLLLAEGVLFCGTAPGAGMPAMPLPVPAPHSARRSSAASYCSFGGASALMADLPESPTAKMAGGLGLGPLGFPRSSRRASTASYISNGTAMLLPDLPEALTLVVGQPPPGLPLGVASQRARRASAASYVSSGCLSETRVGAGALLGGAAGVRAMAGKDGRASGSSPRMLGGVPMYSAPRARRASCTSSISSFSFGGSTVLSNMMTPELLYEGAAGVGAGGGANGCCFVPATSGTQQVLLPCAVDTQPATSQLLVWEQPVAAPVVARGFVAAQGVDACASATTTDMECAPPVCVGL